MNNTQFKSNFDSSCVENSVHSLLMVIINIDVLFTQDTLLPTGPTLVHGTVGTEEVKVLLALNIPHEDAFVAFKAHRHWMVVVCTIFVLQRDELDE